MGRALRIEYPGAHYHVTSRGNERKDVFKSRKDREQFLTYLESAVTRYGAVIHAYCLMTNHYHLLIETPDGNLSRIMQHVGSYCVYFWVIGLSIKAIQVTQSFSLTKSLVSFLPPAIVFAILCEMTVVSPYLAWLTA